MREDFKTRKARERKAKEYEPWLKMKAVQYARKYLPPGQRENPDDVADFVQEGWLGFTKAFDANTGQYKHHAYYRTAIENSMKDYSRKYHRPNRAYVEGGTIELVNDGNGNVAAMVEEGEVTTDYYQAQGSADDVYGGLLWGDNPDLD